MEAFKKKRKDDRLELHYVIGYRRPTASAIRTSRYRRPSETRARRTFVTETLFSFFFFVHRER